MQCPRPTRRRSRPPGRGCSASRTGCSAAGTRRRRSCRRRGCAGRARTARRCASRRRSWPRRRRGWRSTRRSPRAARRETYIGPWLPEPVDTAADPLLGAVRGEALELGGADAAGEAHADRARDLRPARGVRLLLPRDRRRAGDRARPTRASSPRVRAAKLEGGRRATADADAHRRLLDAIVAAAQAGDVEALERMLAEDVVTYADGGGVVNAARKPIVGRERVAKALVGLRAQVLAGRDVRRRSTPTGSRRCSSQRDGETIVVAVDHGLRGRRRADPVRRQPGQAEIACHDLTRCPV